MNWPTGQTEELANLLFVGKTGWCPEQRYSCIGKTRLFTFCRCTTSPFCTPPANPHAGQQHQQQHVVIAAHVLIHRNLLWSIVGVAQRFLVEGVGGARAERGSFPDGPFYQWV